MASTILNYTEVRQNLKKTLDQVTKSRAPLTITRRNGEPVVMIAKSEMDALLETVHLLQSPRNAARLIESIAQLNEGETRQFGDLDDAEAECQRQSKKGE